MTDLAELLERVKAATAPDRAIDRALAYHLEGTGVEKERKLYAEMGDAMWVPGANGLTPHDVARGDHIRQEWQSGTRGRRGSYKPVRWMCCDGPSPLTNSPAFTASLDAALSLVERVLPGWMVSLLLSREHGRHFASVRNGSIIDPDKIEGTGEATTPPIALLAAFLSALTASRTDVGGDHGA